MRDRRASFAYLAPATILPVPAEDVADLALGFLDFTTLPNMTMLGKAFQASGLRAVPAEPHEAGGLFMHVMSDRVRVSLPAQLREQMLNELMTPASLARAVTHAIRVVELDPPAERAQSFVAFQHEERVWTGFPPARRLRLGRSRRPDASCARHGPARS